MTTNSSGVANFSYAPSGNFNGQAIVATATNSGGNTSEFSQSVTQGLPLLSVNDVNATEGNSGTSDYVFTVTLSAASTQTVTVTFATANNTATAPSDYTAISGTTITLSPGQTSRNVTVHVNGDTTVEPNETFFANLSNPVNAALGDSQGVGTILNNDDTALRFENDEPSQ